MGWLNIGMKILPYIAASVSAVEKFVRGKGKQKQDAAIDMVKTILQTAEAGADRDLLNDAVVEAAARKVVDAYVEFQNVVATRGGKDA